MPTVQDLNFDEYIEIYESSTPNLKSFQSNEIIDEKNLVIN